MPSYRSPPPSPGPQVSCTVAVMTPKEVKIWDAVNGKILKVYRSLSRSHLTSLCLDGRKRKLIVGDHEGRIQVSHMQLIHSHDDESSHR